MNRNPLELLQALALKDDKIRDLITKELSDEDINKLEIAQWMKLALKQLNNASKFESQREEIQKHIKLIDTSDNTEYETYQYRDGEQIFAGGPDKPGEASIYFQTLIKRDYYYLKISDRMLYYYGTMQPINIRQSAKMFSTSNSADKKMTIRQYDKMVDDITQGLSFDHIISEQHPSSDTYASPLGFKILKG